MIKSMTGFGRCEIQKESRKFTVELKSVNHRYLDVNIRMPKKLNFFETAIRTLLKQYANRGKVDIFISCEDLSQQQMMLKYNAALAAEYMRYFRQMSEEFHIANDVKVSALSHYPEVLTMEEQTEDEEILWSGLKEALEGAFGQFVETRVLEGSHLKEDILQKLSGMESLVEQVEARSPQIVAEYRAKLEEKVKEVPNVEKLLAIKGVGMSTVIGFIAEVGDIGRFTDPKQIQKLAGLEIVKKSSGKKKGQPRISKRGRRKLRRTMYESARALMTWNPAFQDVFLYYRNRTKKPLGGMQAKIAVACKAIRIFYVVLKTGCDFDEEKFRKDIIRPEAA